MINVIRDITDDGSPAIKRGAKMHRNARPGLVYYPGHTAEAWIVPTKSSYLYAYGESFGINVSLDQQRSHPTFDPEYTIHWEYEA